MRLNVEVETGTARVKGGVFPKKVAANVAEASVLSELDRVVYTGSELSRSSEGTFERTV